MVARSFQDVDSQLNRMSEESTRSHESMSTNQVVLEQERVGLEHLIQQVEEVSRHVATARNEYEEIQGTVRALEKESAEYVTRKHQLQSQMNDAKLHLEQASMKEAYLTEQIRERYVLELADVAERYREREG